MFNSCTYIIFFPKFFSNLSILFNSCIIFVWLFWFFKISKPKIFFIILSLMAFVSCSTYFDLSISIYIINWIEYFFFLFRFIIRYIEIAMQSVILLSKLVIIRPFALMLWFIYFFDNYFFIFYIIISLIHIYSIIYWIFL